MAGGARRTWRGSTKPSAFSSLSITSASRARRPLFRGGRIRTPSAPAGADVLGDLSAGTVEAAPQVHIAIRIAVLKAPTQRARGRADRVDRAAPARRAPSPRRCASLRQAALQWLCQDVRGGTGDDNPDTRHRQKACARVVERDRRSLWPGTRPSTAQRQGTLLPIVPRLRPPRCAELLLLVVAGAGFEL